MHFPEYDPNLHDLYLYGIGNTGYPIGLNPNCIIYDAKESYKWMNTIYRDFINASGSVPIPPNLSLAYKPNYYNQESARSYWVGPNFLMSASHMFLSRPCIDIQNFEQEVWFETGLTFAKDENQFTFWKDDTEFSGFTSYGNLDYIYELVQNPIPIGNSYSFNLTVCPNGITGIPIGTTFYRATSRRDIGIFKVHGPPISETRNGPYMRTVSPYSLLSDSQKQNIKNYVYRYGSSLYETTNLSNLILLEIENDNLYLMGSNQQVKKIEKLIIAIAAFYNNDPPNGLGINFSPNITLWGGDSSGLICYKKNNELFGIGLNSGGGAFPGFFAMLNNERYPSMKYLLEHTDIPITYYYSNTDEKTLATKSQFNLLDNKLSDLKQKIEQIKTNLVG